MSRHIYLSESDHTVYIRLQIYWLSVFLTCNPHHLYYQMDTEETIASPGMRCTDDGRRTERKDDQIGKKEVENKGMYRVRRRPLYQSSDEEEDDEEGANSECTPRKRFPVDKLPNLHRITGSIERLKSTYLQFSPHCM